jgi:hypothetical protein
MPCTSRRAHAPAPGVLARGQSGQAHGLLARGALLHLAGEGAQGLGAGGEELLALGGGEVAPRPGIQRPGELGMAQLVRGDAGQGVAHLGIPRGAGLPAGEQGAKRLAHAALHGILPGERGERARARGLHHHGRQGRAVAQGECPHGLGMAHLLGGGAAGGAHQVRGGSQGGELLASRSKAGTEAASRWAMRANIAPNSDTRPGTAPSLTRPSGRRPSQK